jgi:DNA-binding protein H-NS
VLGPLPEHLKNHRALNGKADWKQEQMDMLTLKYETFKKAKMVTLLKFSQKLEQQSEMLEMEKATALMEEREAAYQQNRDRVNRGEAALEFKTTMPIPQLSFLPNLPPMQQRSSAMHQRPAPAPVSNWPREGPSCRQNEAYSPIVTVKEEYDSADNSENDTESDRKAVKEFRRRLKEHNIEKARQHAKKAKAASRSPPLPPPLPSGSNA